MVISILALLIALLLPALGDARYQAKLTLCATRARHVALSAVVYASDHNQYSPDGSWKTTLPDQGYFTGATEALHCPIPSDTGHGAFLGNLNPGWLYTMNIDLAARTGWPWFSGDPARLSEVVNPSRCLYFSDGGWRGGTFPHYHDYAAQSFFGRTDAAWAFPPHLDGAHVGSAGFPISRGINVASVDGHVSFMRWLGETEPISLRNNPSYAMSHKPYWGRPGTQSWNLAPHED